MKSPDKIKATPKGMAESALEIAYTDCEFVEYIRLDKVKELIEAERQVWIEQQKDSEIDLNIVALDVIEGQLEGLE